MRNLRTLAVLALLAAWQGSAHAVAVPGLFNTGVNDSGVVLVGGAVDPHYTLITSADPAYPGPNAIVTAVTAGGYWVANNSVSKWTAPAADENYPALGTAHPAGTYTYRLSFDLTGIDPKTVSISGQWGVDNAGEIQLNGASTGNSTTNYNPLVGFTISTGFVAGVNHLDFVITNYPSGGSNPTAVRVNGISGTGVATTGVGDSGIRSTIQLSAPHPNPVRGAAYFTFTLPRASTVRLTVRDLAGRTVRTLVEREHPAGEFDAAWDGRRADGDAAQAGVYLLDLEADGRHVTRRIALVH